MDYAFLSEAFPPSLDLDNTTPAATAATATAAPVPNFPGPFAGVMSNVVSDADLVALVRLFVFALIAVLALHALDAATR